MFKTEKQEAHYYRLQLPDVMKPVAITQLILFLKHLLMSLQLNHHHFRPYINSSAGFSNWNDNCNTTLAVENLDTSAEGTTQSESSVILTEKENIGSTSQTSTKSAKRVLVSSLDNFAKKKKASNERLEDLLSKSSQAISDLATTYKHKQIVEKKEESPDPHAIVISQALKSVIPENQLSCLITVLQLIEKFKE